MTDKLSEDYWDQLRAKWALSSDSMQRYAVTVLDNLRRHWPDLIFNAVQHLASGQGDKRPSIL